MKLLNRIITVCTALLLSFPAPAQDPNNGTTMLAPGASAAPLSLSAAERARITREIISKWQSAADNRPGGGGPRWARNITHVIANADPDNIIRATTATSLELLHAMLNGYIPDPTTAAPGGRIGNGAVAPNVLGSTIADTTYSPLPNGRCRVADSRVLASPMPARGTRQIWIEQITSYSGQGGNGTYSNGDGSANCGLPTNATAYALSITLLSPAADGLFKVYYTGKPYQTGNSILFNGGDFGANGDLIVQSCQSCTYEITVQSSAQVHYVIDVIGYFMPPQATALSCVETATNSVTLSNGQLHQVYAPACPAGYTMTATNCTGSDWNIQLATASKGHCMARNTGGNSNSLSASATCCKVPGR
jgi:hypothetical protein